MACNSFGTSHLMPIAPLLYLSQDDQNEIKHDIFGHMMPLPLAWCHLMPMPSSMAPVDSLEQDNQNRI